MTVSQGCGRGHDVAMLALHGLETYGLEVSQEAVDVANNNIQSQLSEPSPKNFGPRTQRQKPAQAAVIHGDFFERGWETQFGDSFQGFDVIYDYTVSAPNACIIYPNYCSSYAHYSPRCGRTGHGA